jgi:uncharacterized membrane protein YhaH (DUF805 family)
VNVLNLLFSFDGRVNRAKFWLAVPIWALATMLPPLSLGLLGLRVSYVSVALLLLVVALPILVSMLAVGIKRLHDRDKPAWWLLIYFFIPYFFAPLLAGLMPSNESSDNAELVAMAAIMLPFFVWGWVELGCIPGTPGPNQFGEDPLGGDTALQPG